MNLTKSRERQTTKSINNFYQESSAIKTVKKVSFIEHTPWL